MLAVKANEELNIMPQQVVVQPDTYMLVYEHRIDVLVERHPTLKKVPCSIRHVWVRDGDNQRWWKKMLAQECLDITSSHTVSLNRSLFNGAGAENTVCSRDEVLFVLNHWLGLYPEAHLEQLDLEAGMLYMAEVSM